MGENREIEKRNDGEKGLVAYWNGDLVDMYNPDTAKYSFFLWLNLGIQTLKLDRCYCIVLW